MDSSTHALGRESTIDSFPDRSTATYSSASEPMTLTDHADTGIQEIEFHYSLIDHVADIHPRPIESDWVSFVMGLAEPDIRGDQALSDYFQALKHAKRKALREISSKADSNTCKLAIRQAQQPIKDHWKVQKDGPAWIPAVFGQQPNAKGHQRHAGNVTALYAAVLDFDSHISRARIEGILHGFCYAAHTSYTHHLQAERWRVIIPLRHPVPSFYAYALYDYFEARFGGGLDTKCRNPDHLYFLPACPPDAVQGLLYPPIRRRCVCLLRRISASAHLMKLHIMRSASPGSLKQLKSKASGGRALHEIRVRAVPS